MPRGPPGVVRCGHFSVAGGECRALFNRVVSLDPHGCAQLSDCSRMFTVGEAKADPTTHQTAERPPGGQRCGCSIHSEVIRFGCSDRRSAIHRRHPGRRLPADTAAGNGAKIPLITRIFLALMDTRLTAPRKEKALQTTVRKEIEALRTMTLKPAPPEARRGIRRGDKVAS